MKRKALALPQQLVSRQRLSAQDYGDLVGVRRMLRTDHHRFLQQLGRGVGRKTRSRTELVGKYQTRSPSPGDEGVANACT
jgi:hypothetical protein